MKPTLIITAALVLAGGLSVVSGQDVGRLTLPGSTPPAAAPSEPAGAPGAAAASPATVAATTTYTEGQILEVIGWLMGRNTQVETFAFTPEQLTSLFKGFSVAAADKEAPYQLEKIGSQIDDFVSKKQVAWMNRLKAKGEAESVQFFAALKSKPGVTILPSGLAYEIIKPGTGPNPKATDTVKAHYTGQLVTGEIFDTSREPREPGQPVEPTEFELDKVIPGWTEGLQKIAKGGQIKLYVPAKLAYGDDGRGDIPPASTLIFDVELIDFKPTPGPASLGK